MSSHHLGQVVLRLIIAVRLYQREGACAEIDLVEDDGFHSLGLWISRNNAVLADGESLRRKARADSALLLAQVVEIAHVAELEFIHQRRAEGLGVAQTCQLRPAVRQRVETGHVGSALLGGVGIVQIVVIDEIIRRQGAQSASSGHPLAPIPCHR